MDLPIVQKFYNFTSKLLHPSENLDLNNGEVPMWFAILVFASFTSFLMAYCVFTYFTVDCLIAVVVFFIREVLNAIIFSIGILLVIAGVYFFGFSIVMYKHVKKYLLTQKIEMTKKKE